jgi:tagaturonate reductase
VLPTIDGDPAELRAFAAAILERFTNPFLHHRLADIALNAVSKWRTRNLPVLVDRVHAGEPAPLTAFSLAAVLLLQSGYADVEGFTPADDAGTLQLLAAVSDGNDWDLWTRTAVHRLDLAAGLDEAQTEALVRDVAAVVTAIRTHGAWSALRAALG